MTKPIVSSTNQQPLLSSDIEVEGDELGTFDPNSMFDPSPPDISGDLGSMMPNQIHGVVKLKFQYDTEYMTLPVLGFSFGKLSAAYEKDVITRTSYFQTLETFVLPIQAMISLMQAQDRKYTISETSWQDKPIPLEHGIVVSEFYTTPDGNRLVLKFASTY